MLQGDPGGTARDQVAVRGAVDLLDQEQVGRPREPQDVDGERAGVVLRAVDPRVPQRLGRLPERRLQAGQGVSPFRAAALSASTSDWITGSRSPSRTCMRLLAL